MSDGADRGDGEQVVVLHGDARRAGLVALTLAGAGFRTTVETSGLRGLERMRRGDVTLVVLDLALSDIDGLSVLRRAADVAPDVGVLVLSSRSDVRSKVICLELGACDYVTTPFDPAELIARVRAHARDRRASSARYLRVGDMALDLRRRVVANGSGDVHLTMRESLLLEFLMEREGEVVSREAIRMHVWGSTFDPGTNVVDVCIAALRQKLGDRCVTTVRNVGYAFAGPHHDDHGARMTVAENRDRKVDTAAPA